MSKYDLENLEDELELDDDLKEQFGGEVSSAVSKFKYKNPNKNLKFKKDDIYKGRK